jgi:spermidine synthase
MLPSAIVFGFNFPVAATLIAVSWGRGVPSAESVGVAYAANTSGAIFAAVGTGFFLVPWIGSFRVVAVSAVLNILLAVALLLRSGPQGKVLLAMNAVMTAFAIYAGWSTTFYDRALASFGTALYWNNRSERLTLEEKANLEDTIFFEDGLNATISVSRSDSYIALKTNGKVDASTVDRETQLLLGHLGAVFHPHPQRVLIIGFGAGMTASALLRYPEVERLDCIEIEPAVLRAAPFLEQLNRGVLGDPRLHLVMEDARNVLLTTEDRYDLIVSEPSNPWIAGIATLFTDEYYKAVREHLAPGGIFVQWIQGYSLEPIDFRMILATLVPHFPDVTLWHSAGPDFLLLARTDTKPLDFDRSRALWNESRLHEDFSSLRLARPESWPVYFSLNDSEVRTLALGSLHNTDDRTLLEYRAPRAMIGESHVNELTAEIKHVQRGLLPELRDSDKRAALEATAESSVAFFDSRSREFVRALEAEPATASLEVVRGRQALRDKQIDVATEHFQRAATMEPNDVHALLWLARVRHMTPGDTQSGALLARVLERDPQNLEALATKAEFAREAHDWRGAAEAFAKRIRFMNGPPASDYCRLGELQARSGDLVSAVEVFRMGIEKDPYSYICHLELGEIARANGRLEEARQHLEFVERHYPDAAPGIYLSLGAVYRAQGNLSKAIEVLQKGRRIFPDDQAIGRMISGD